MSCRNRAGVSAGVDLKLLIVDDEKLDREGLSRQLDWDAYSVCKVFLAKNGPTALEILRSNEIDLLLTDVKMPAMSGIDLARHAQQINPSIKIIFISGYDDFEYMKGAIQINAYEYILKPVQTEELAACITDVVNSIRLRTIDYEIADCLTKLDLDKATNLIDNMLDFFEQRKGCDPYAIKYHCINIISRMEMTLRDLNVQAEGLFGKKISLIENLLKFEAIPDIRQWMKNIMHITIEHLNVRKKSHASVIAGEVISYIESKYSEDISLNAIAKSLFYTPNYLGSVFKQETGQYFSEYLTEYRMKMAAVILRDRKIKVLEAALSVGYKDMPTFIKNFKSIHGVTPSEYRGQRIT